ncbi:MULTISPECIES: hypothetical protein [Pseudomonas]|uniref:hypothetical protein n=1 Tax=Pseudomonas TaxID=286 RepID=UPI0002D34EF5|nr:MULTISPECIES: hypothetical protein [Pseudomonas]MDC7830745.1 hypothetical protein [Pseudomonas benzopyrenica]MXS19720.1 hypothetical protein [Pseudomonas oryzihabitans]NRH43477.1 hypothetical protein [Pseudomonas sp. MS15a(2019)]UUW71981.1 hypothetical protein NRG74_00835 [Pseudomonas psychrotolerans]SEP25142.1 hypothetical protein SAMN02787149_10535 [Pseudomonas sp. Snoq117.2]
MEALDLLQWPAMAITLLAAWLVASQRQGRRNLGFWVFLLSNGLWIAWGLQAEAYALIVLQLGLAAMNLRGVRRNAGEAPAAAVAEASGRA